MSLKYIALLRGINVGGNNIIKMADLRAALNDLGLENVQTYIQSGNVVFSSSIADAAKLESKIEKGLANKFDYHGFVLVISEKLFKTIISKAPKDFGTKPDKYRYDVIFFKLPMTPAESFEAFELRDGVDQVWQGEHAIYYSRLDAERTKSKMSKIIGKKKYYDFMTIRNWRTSQKLLEMLES